MKRCATCGQDLPVDRFSKDRAAKDGMQPRCKACVSAYMRQRAASKAEELRAKKRAWYEANADHARATELARFHANRDEILAQRRARRAEGRLPENYDAEQYEKSGRWVQMMRKFGLSRAEYEAQAKKQHDQCLICGLPESARRRRWLAVDHCHQAEALGEMRIRGLLCLGCNNRLRHVEAGAVVTEQFAALAATYLARPPVKSTAWPPTT